jgi:predicted Fe-Mo cluster-binding NifX family protein
MKAAIPTFGERVSPRFDCAARFLLVVIDQGRIAERVEIDALNWAPHERINRLVSLGVEVLVCGGIDRGSSESLRSVGITLHARVAGSIEDVLAALVRGDQAFGCTHDSASPCGKMGRGRHVQDTNHN